MTINYIHIGDIVGESGREMVRQSLPLLREKYRPDLITANAENASHGRGLHPNQYEELIDMGLDALTSGDHIWCFKEIKPILESGQSKLIRPANYVKASGSGFIDLIVKGKRVRLINLIGRSFMSPNVDSPFFAFDRLVAELPKPDVVMVDFHAEATSEKRAMAEYVDGRAALVAGTHTHVPTADARILASGTGFISDIGMVGPLDSCLGADKKEVLNSFLTGLPWRYNLAVGECELGAVFCQIELEGNRATEISHIRLT